MDSSRGLPVHKYRVLFVDDDEAVLRSLGDYFQKIGHEVFRAGSGEEGLATLRRVNPDVTILDLYMPGLSGMQTLEQIRRDYPDAMVLMLTAYGDIDTAVEAMSLGAENFLTKPIDMPHLVAAVEKAAEKGALRRENEELRERLRPSLRRLLVRWGAIGAVILAALFLGQWIGGGNDEARRRSPIPVPIDGDTALPTPTP